MDAAHVNLMHRLRAGDAEAARALWHALGGRLGALARALLRSSADSAQADDLVQGAFVRLIELDEAHARAIRSPAAYLARAVHTGALNLRRSGARRAEREHAHFALRLADGGAHAAHDDAIARAVDALDEPLREAVLLRHVAGLTFDEMAEVTGTPRATLAERHAAALARLRERLAEPTPPGARAGRVEGVTP